MLKPNIQKVANLRGINNVFSFLRKIGISHNVAGRYASGEALSISFRHLETISIALNCTPNDLLEWTPPSTLQNASTHALTPLLKNTQTENFKQLLQTLPLDKINQIAQILSEK
jgi:DNA-binding Xre family transcriptional regulator